MKSVIFLAVKIIFLSSVLYAQAAGNNAQFVSTSTGSRITVPSTVELKTFSVITLEAWIKPSGGREWSLIIGKQLNSSDANPWYSYRLYKARLVSPAWPDYISFTIAPAAGGNESGLTTSLLIQPDVWTHIAGVYDGSTMKIYLNGQLDGTFNRVGDVRQSDLPLFVGHAPWTNNNNYNGQMDELRIWNVVRTADEIKNNMHRSLVGTETGLVAYYPFGEAAGSTTTDDASTYNHIGTLSGAASIVASSTVPIGTEGKTVESVSETSIGQTDGQMKITITSVPSAVNFLGIYQSGSFSNPPVVSETFPAGIDKRSDVIWGIVERGDVTSNIVLQYGGLGGIASEENLKILKRTNAASSWTDVTSAFTQNLTENTFTKLGETSYSEFAIGSTSDNSLPVTLSEFSGKSFNGFVQLKWATESEIENLGFNVYRGFAGKPLTLLASFTNTASLEGYGSTNNYHRYSYNDNRVDAGYTYQYLLADVDYSGVEKRHEDCTISLMYVPVADEVKPVKFALGQAFPNPFNPSTSICYELPESSDVVVSICDLMGHRIWTYESKAEPAGKYSLCWDGINTNGSQVCAGVYLIILEASEFRAVQKLVFIK